MEDKAKLYINYLISTGMYTEEEAKLTASRLYDWYETEKKTTSNLCVTHPHRYCSCKRDEEQPSLKRGKDRGA